MSYSATLASSAPTPQIWVKRYVWQWVPIPAASETCPPPLVPQAVCTFEPADKVLPAIKDWPRWKTDNDAQLPVDEYWRATFVPQVTCPEGSQCGPQVQWSTVWTKIETPRAWRWVSSGCPCDQN
jgi:hypothetical protein